MPKESGITHLAFLKKMEVTGFLYQDSLINMRELKKCSFQEPFLRNLLKDELQGTKATRGAGVDVGEQST